MKKKTTQHLKHPKQTKMFLSHHLTIGIEKILVEDRSERCIKQ